MSNITDRLGVQSFCFRGFKDNTKVAAMVRELELGAIEICGIHADFSDINGWKDIVKTYNDQGIRVVGIGVQTFEGADSERDWFECAKAAGCDYISAHFNIDSFQTAVPRTARLADEYDINIAIHNHGGYRFNGSPDELDYLMELGGPRIGLCLDTAWCLQIGPGKGKPVDWAETYAQRLYAVHIKDFTFEPTGQWNDVIVGTGNLDLPGLMQSLEQHQFATAPVLEYEADVDNPVPALAQCVQQVRGVAAQ